MSRASARAKGNEIERRAVEVLEALGYTCDRARPDVRWIPKHKPNYQGDKVPLTPISMAHDILGVADVLAVANEHVHVGGSVLQRILLVQTTTPDHLAHRRNKLRTLIDPWRELAEQIVELWAWYGGRRRDKQVGEGDVLAQCFQRWPIEGPALGVIHYHEIVARKPDKLIEEYATDPTSLAS